jgi:hypothetical protein
LNNKKKLNGILNLSSEEKVFSIVFNPVKQSFHGCLVPCLQINLELE